MMSVEPADQGGLPELGHEHEYDQGACRYCQVPDPRIAMRAALVGRVMTIGLLSPGTLITLPWAPHIGGQVIRRGVGGVTVRWKDLRPSTKVYALKGPDGKPNGKFEKVPNEWHTEWWADEAQVLVTGWAEPSR